MLIMLALMSVWPALTMAASTDEASAAPQASVAPPPPPRLRVSVGTDQNYPPFEFVDDQGRPAGFNIDLLRALAEVMGLELDIRPGPWNSVRKAIEDGRLDMVSGMYYSPERDKLVDFSVPFIIVYESMFVREHSALSSLTDLKNREIIVQSGDIMHDYALANKLAGRIVTVNNTIDGLRLLASGKHDGALLPKLQGQYLLKKYHITHLRAAGPAILAQEYCFAVRNGNKNLAAILDQGLSILKTSGRYKEIRRKWFGVLERGNFEALYKIVVVIFSSLLLLLAVSWLWNWSLRRHVRRKTRELADELAAHERTLCTLKDREAHLRALVESSSDAILVLDKQLCMTDCNPAFINLLGYGRKEITGHSFALILPEDENIGLLERTAFSDIAQMGFRRDERQYKNKKGGLVPMEITVSEKILPDGRLEGYVAIMRDISKRRHAEEEKLRLEGQLGQVHKMEAIGTLAAGIAHDFNNILSSIIGYTVLSRRTLPADSQARQDLDEVLEAANRAKGLVRQILTYSRQAEQERRPEKLTALIEDSLRLIRASLPATIEIIKDFQVKDDLVLADTTQINQVLINLVTNAAQAMNSGHGRLQIGLHDIELTESEAAAVPTAVPGHHLELTVTDNGHGMDKAVLNRIFDPFFTTKRRGEGTGMGLSVVHGIVKDHGGFIQVDSQLGTGTSFRVILPRFDGVCDSTPPPGAIIGGNERILLIDDEERVANAWRRILMSLGYDVTAATHPAEGLRMFRASPEDFDLVLTDLDMPQMNGLELTGKLKQSRPDIPVVLYTGFSAKSERSRSTTHWASTAACTSRYPHLRWQIRCEGPWTKRIREAVPGKNHHSRYWGNGTSTYYRRRSEDQPPAGADRRRTGASGHHLRHPGLSTSGLHPKGF